MSIKETVLSKDFTMSMEVFPPRWNDDPSRYKSVTEKCKRIIDLHPAYLSVTHRAGNCFDETLKICEMAVKEGVPAVAHMRARDIGFDEARTYVEACIDAGVMGILPVTGDEYLTDDGTSTDAFCFKSSTDLTAFLRGFDGIEVLGTYYPEDNGSSWCVSEKYRLGAEVFVSQMVFDYDSYVNSNVNLVNCVVRVPGILPILSEKSYIKQSSQVCIPRDWMYTAGKYPVHTGEAGVQYSIDFINKCKNNGVRHVHLFTMDNYGVAKNIQEAVL